MQERNNISKITSMKISNSKLKDFFYSNLLRCVMVKDQSIHDICLFECKGEKEKDLQF